MALSNIKRAPLGIGLEAIYGDFTHTAGNASQTQVVTGGKVYGVIINPQVAAGDAVDAQVPYSVSTSGALTTITILANAEITGGTFLIIVGTGV